MIPSGGALLGVLEEAAHGCGGCMILTLAMVLALLLPVLVVAQMIAWRLDLDW